MTPQVSAHELNSLAETIRHNNAWRVKHVGEDSVQVQNRATGYDMLIYTRQQWDAVIRQTETGNTIDDFQTLALRLVSSLDDEIATLTSRIDALMQEASTLETTQQSLKDKRQALESAINAVMGYQLTSTPPVKQEPEPVTHSTVKKRRRTGYNKLPSGKSQQAWIEEQLVIHGTIAAKDLTRDLQREFDNIGVSVSHDILSHNVHARLSYLTKLTPPIALRIGNGVYRSVSQEQDNG